MPSFRSTEPEQIEADARDYGMILANLHLSCPCCAVRSKEIRAALDPEFTSHQRIRLAVVLSCAYLGDDAPHEAHQTFETAFMQALEATQRAMRLAHRPETER